MEFCDNEKKERKKKETKKTYQVKSPLVQSCDKGHFVFVKETR